MGRATRFFGGHAARDVLFRLEFQERYEFLRVIPVRAIPMIETLPSHESLRCRVKIRLLGFQTSRLPGFSSRSLRCGMEDPSDGMHQLVPTAGLFDHLFSAGL